MFTNGKIIEPGLASRVYQRFNRLTVEPYLDYATAPSQFMLDMHRQYGLLENIESGRLRLGIEHTNEYTNWEPTDNEFRCLFAGQLTYQKGVDVLIDAFSNFTAPTAPTARLDILGKGPERETLESSVDDTRITFHGFVSEAELHERFKDAHLTIVPSRWYDNSPMVIYESFMHGTPVLGAEIGGIPELIEEGTTGYLFEPEDPEKLRVSLKRAEQDIDESIHSNVCARAQELTLTKHVEDLIELYEGLV